MDIESSNFMVSALFVGIPVISVLCGWAMYNMYTGSRYRQHLCDRDQMFDEQYRRWLESMRSRRELPRACSPAWLEKGESCYSFDAMASLHEPEADGRPRAYMPPHPDAADEFQMGESEFTPDSYGALHFLGNGRLYVTDRRVEFNGVGVRRVIGLEDILSVSASYSSVFIDSAAADRPMLFGGVNGQRIRDIIQLLMERAA